MALFQPLFSGVSRFGDMEIFQSSQANFGERFPSNQVLSSTDWHRLIEILGCTLAPLDLDNTIQRFSFATGFHQAPVTPAMPVAPAAPVAAMAPVAAVAPATPVAPAVPVAAVAPVIQRRPRSGREAQWGIRTI